MRVFIGMECSGVVRNSFQAAGHCAISCDIKSNETGEDKYDLIVGGHFKLDVFEALETLRMRGWVPDLGIFHPDCTYLTSSAEWAYKDPDFDRYPNVGYHQRVKQGTLTGHERREARQASIDQCNRILSLPIERIVMENPVGALSKAIRKPNQIIQPYMFGHNARKATCLWLDGLDCLKPTRLIAPRIVNGRELWDNQTDTGQNKLPPSKNRAADRARTYQGVADAMVLAWGKL